MYIFSDSYQLMKNILFTFTKWTFGVPNTAVVSIESFLHCTVKKYCKGIFVMEKVLQTKM